MIRKVLLAATLLTALAHLSVNSSDRATVSIVGSASAQPTLTDIPSAETEVGPSWRKDLSNPDRKTGEVPISLGGESTFGTKLFWDKPFRIRLEVFGDGERIMETDISLDPEGLKRGRTGYRWNRDTDSLVDLNSIAEITVQGKIESTEGFWPFRKSRRFQKTYKIVDLKPWTAVLRYEGMEFGDRLEAFQKNVSTLDPDFSEFLKIGTTELSKEEVMDRARAKIGADIPRVLEAFATRTVHLDDQAFFVGPAEAYKNTHDEERARWLDLAEFDKVFAGEPEELFVLRGQEHGDIARRHWVISNYFGDGLTTIVWNPFAQEDEAAFFEVEPDTRELRELRNYFGQPLSALDVILGVLDWSDGWMGGRWDYPDSWISVAVEERLPNTDLESVLVVDSSNPNGVLSVVFNGETGEPFAFFEGQTWLSETIFYH